MAVKMRAAKVVKPVEALKAGPKRRFERKDERAKLSAAHTKKWQDPDYKARQAAAHTLGVYAQAAESNRLTAQRKRQEKEKNAQAA
jgi:hypothetical protein